ncbi:hypothetical protein HYDPIDRAFT_119882 [Hydnomerulius pinastri MD-312]|uniref:Uncharacterized protein n=1 Tax=Hydnomerulius pinastri MD-312 TaxID=994086 RepID=A0A0C9VXX1_9AGAM|nr:hypothetical protein HYDPIDRAFT_119882 [Hydnomerulius pinastri MD-312]
MHSKQSDRSKPNRVGIVIIHAPLNSVGEWMMDRSRIKRLSFRRIDISGVVVFDVAPFILGKPWTEKDTVIRTLYPISIQSGSGTPT